MSRAIRAFDSTDYDAAYALWRAIPGVGLSGADERAPIEAFLRRNPGTSFVAVDGDRVVGTILCGHDGRRGLVHHLVTAPSHRRRGIARTLLRAGLGALAREGIAKCHILVFRDNDAGRDFWRAMAATERVELELFSIGTRDRE